MQHGAVALSFGSFPPFFVANSPAMGSSVRSKRLPKSIRPCTMPQWTIAVQCTREPCFPGARRHRQQRHLKELSRPARANATLNRDGSLGAPSVLLGRWRRRCGHFSPLRQPWHKPWPSQSGQNCLATASASPPNPNEPSRSGDEGCVYPAARRNAGAVTLGKICKALFSGFYDDPSGA